LLDAAGKAERQAFGTTRPYLGRCRNRDRVKDGREQVGQGGFNARVRLALQKIPGTNNDISRLCG